MNRRIPLPAILCSLLFALPVVAIAGPVATPQMRMEIVLIRHGVRSPTAAPAALANDADRPWQAWPVAPGVLTPHGADIMRGLGERYRRESIADRLWSGDCAVDLPVTVIADSTPRNRDSAAALLEGFAPGCHAGYNALPSGQANPLFHRKGAKDTAGPVVTAAQVPRGALVALQQVLLGCSDTACLDRAKAQGKHVLLDGDDAQALAKAMKRAGTLSENLMLEYAQGFPPEKVAWGRADADALGRLIVLHNASFAIGKKSLPAAAIGGSNLLAHIAATLDDAAGASSAIDPLAPKGKRVVFVIGHDTNLAQLAGLLGLDWHSPGQPDAYPPGGALVFDLFETEGRYSVRMRTLMPTLEALHKADLRPDGALVQTVPVLPGCGSQAYCPLKTFRAAVAGAVDAAHVDRRIPAMPPVVPE
jgi:4-phytase/acid phosphatase